MIPIIHLLMYLTKQHSSDLEHQNYFKTKTTGKVDLKLHILAVEIMHDDKYSSPSLIFNKFTDQLRTSWKKQKRSSLVIPASSCKRNHILVNLTPREGRIEKAVQLYQITST